MRKGGETKSATPKKKSRVWKKLLRQMLNKSYANLLFRWAMGGTFCNEWWNDDERTSTGVTRQDNGKGRNGNIDWFLVRQREDRLLFFFCSMLRDTSRTMTCSRRRYRKFAWRFRSLVNGQSRRRCLQQPSFHLEIIKDR